MPPRRRRQLLRGTLMVSVLVLPVLSVPAGSPAFFPILAMPAMFIVPALILGDGGPPPGGSDDDGGGGGGPPRPPAPSSPRGGIPLPDARPARVRLRDHGDRLRQPRSRRGAPRHPARPRRRVDHR